MRRDAAGLAPVVRVGVRGYGQAAVTERGSQLAKRCSGTNAAARTKSTAVTAVAYT